MHHLIYPYLNSMGHRNKGCSPYAEEETGTQRGEVICPQLGRAELESSHALPGPRALCLTAPLSCWLHRGQILAKGTEPQSVALCPAHTLLLGLFLNDWTRRKEVKVCGLETPGGRS